MIEEGKNIWNEKDFSSFKLLQKLIAVICIAIPIILRGCDIDDYNPNKINFNALSSIQGDSTTIVVDTSIIKYLVGCDSQLLVKDKNSNVTLLQSTKLQKVKFGFRSSISHYAYSSNSYLYGMLYCMAAMLFIYNGVIYLRLSGNKELLEYLNLRRDASYYNIIIGLLLILVVLHPLHDKELLHYVFSVLFFVGNIVVIAFFPNPKEKPFIKVIRYSLAVIALISIIIPFILKERFPVLFGEWISLFAIAVHLIFVSVSKETAVKIKEDKPLSNQYI